METVRDSRKQRKSKVFFFAYLRARLRSHPLSLFLLFPSTKAVTSHVTKSRKQEIHQKSEALISLVSLFLKWEVRGKMRIALLSAIFFCEISLGLFATVSKIHIFLSFI